MGYIEKRTRGDGTTAWRARYRKPDGTPAGETFDRRIDAQRFLATIEADKLRGTYIDPKAGRVTFREYAEAWRTVQHHEPGTAEQVVSHLTNHAYPILGDRPLASIRKSEIQAWMKGLEGVLAAATIGTVFAWVRSVFLAAVADEVIAKSPCRDVRPPKVDDEKVVPPTDEQVAAMIAAAPPRLRAMVVLAAGSGMRQGEVLGLRPERVEWLRRQVRVVEQLFTPSKGQPYLKRLKSVKARRTIPLVPDVLDALTAHMAAFPPGDDGLLFTNTIGRPWRRNTFIEAFAKVVVAAGLTVGEGDEARPAFTFHDLRHFYASVLIREGASVKLVQELLGHASAVETLETYAHLFPGDKEGSRMMVQRAFNRMRGEQEPDAETAE